MLLNKAGKYAVLTFALICSASAGLLHAQLASDRTPCIDIDRSSEVRNFVPCYFDVSFTLTENIPNADSFSSLSTVPFSLEDSIAWDPRDDDVERGDIEDELEEFAVSWCVATAGLSRINRITLYTDGRPGDFRLINGHGRARAFPGGFRYFKPSAVVYMRGFRFEDSSDYLNAVAAHELAHAALKIYDEYRAESDGGACSRPEETDDPRDTIMNNHKMYQRFSVASDYDGTPTPDTAQYRCHQKSAWEALVQPLVQDHTASVEVNQGWSRRRYFTAIPDGILDTPRSDIFNGLPETAYGCPDVDSDSDEFDDLVTWASDARRVVMLIDNSGSMTGEPAETAKEAVQRAVNTIAIENRPIQVAVVEFGETADAQDPLVPLTMLGHRLAIRGASFSPSYDYALMTTRDVPYAARITRIFGTIQNLLPPGGGTDFHAALAAAQSLLEVPPGDAQDMVIMLSDGQADMPDTSYFQENDVPIYTVGIGDYVDAGVLRKIAADTGGESRFVTDGELDFVDTEALERLPEVFEDFLRVSGMVDNNQMISSNELSLAAVGVVPPTTTFNSVISGVSESVNFVLRWRDGATLEAFTLTRPDGVVIDETYAMSATGTVAYLETPIQASYSVRFPSPGVWTASVKGDGDFTYEVTAYSLITAGISAGAAVLPRASKRTAITYPEPIPVSVNVEGVKQIVGADAVAEITLPDGTVVTLDLRDDGESPDETAEDGVYSGLLGDYDQDGVYGVEVVVNNLEGRARLGEEGASPSSSPPPAPLFQRIVRGQVEVVGTAGKFAPAPPPDDPVEIAPDGVLHWGSIERPGQVNWYGFNAVAGTNYWLQTSHLAGHDGVEMATRLTLYESDAVTEIDSNARYRQSGASSIEWAAPADGAYLVSVAHADDEDRGIYGLTVGQRSILSEAAILRAQRAGGGGSVGWLLLLSLLAALAAACSDGGRSRGRVGR